MKEVPQNLKKWFVAHCIIDLLFAIPLFLFPATFLGFVGWEYFDPMTTRLVAAALFGIGLESYLCRNGNHDQFKGMLRLKIIWSAFATLGILITMFSIEAKPLIGWLLAAVFLSFNLMWVYWWRKLK